MRMAPGHCRHSPRPSSTGLTEAALQSTRIAPVYGCRPSAIREANGALRDEQESTEKAVWGNSALVANRSLWAVSNSALPTVSRNDDLGKSKLPRRLTQNLINWF
jgi:hypothetical protein